MNIYFWQNIPSHIQAPGLREFSARWDGEVNGVWCEGITQDRRQMGWLDPDLGRMKQLVLDVDNPSGHAQEIVRQSAGAIHIFSGLHAYAAIVAAHSHAVAIGAENLGLMVEPGIAMGWKGRLRPLRARLLAQRYRRSIRLVLAMGLRGVEFYQHAGFDSEIVFSYMYQSEPASHLAKVHVNEPVKLIYVGKFIARKGVDVMLQALSRCRSKNWRLTIVGECPERPKLRHLAEKLGVNGAIEWLGAQPSSGIPELLSQHDLCLVPSRFEGWGVVTNEAIQAGIGVLCSDRVTSKDLVERSGAGAVFPSSDARAFASLIDEWVESPERIEAAKLAARSYRETLSPESVGQYLHDVIRYSFMGGARPQTPWL